MTVTINGEKQSFEKELSVAELLRHLELPLEGIAIALNASVVRRKEHGQTIVHDGDAIEIIRAVAGG